MQHHKLKNTSKVASIQKSDCKVILNEQNKSISS